MRTMLLTAVAILLMVIEAPVALGGGVCSEVVPQIRDAGGKWCKAPALKRKPSRKDLKVGRQTVYAGPVISHKGICNIPLEGSASTAAVALSTKYMGANYKGIFPDPMCGRCLCAKIVGFDPKYATNPDAAKKIAPKYYGRIFKGVAKDQCSECEEDHIDVLTDAPYTYTPLDGQPYAASQNSKNGKRIMPTNDAYTVGTWIIEWQFVKSCSVDCNKFFGVKPKRG